MSSISEILTFEESRVLHIYAKKTREEVIGSIEFVLPYITDNEMKDVVKSLLDKLHSISNEDFEELDV